MSLRTSALGFSVLALVAVACAKGSGGLGAGGEGGGGGGVLSGSSSHASSSGHTTSTGTTSSSTSTGSGGAKPCQSPADCDDQNVCTTDACTANVCSHTQVPVDDGNACTFDACDPMTGPTHTPINPDDNNACTMDACDPMTGVTHTPVPVDDGNACTVDACDPKLGVTHVPVSVDDNNACTMDACDPMTGVTHTPISCSDNNACTADSCDPMAGCMNTPIVACANNDGCCPNGCTLANDNDCLWYPTGVQQNVPVAMLTGWTQCYADDYSNSTTAMATILAQCTQNRLLLACRPTGSQTLTLAAAGMRVDVTFDTGTGNTTHNANGIEWYFNNSWSWGFAPGGDPVNRNSCDIEASSLMSGGVDGDKRLCWHSGGGNINAGWRCGTTDSIFGATYDRLVYQAN